MEAIKEYGKIGIVTHLSLSWTCFGGLYFFISKSKQPEKLVRYFKLQDKIPKAAGPFLISGVIYKAMMPARIAMSIVAIPIVVKMFGLEISSSDSDPVEN